MISLLQLCILLLICLLSVTNLHQLRINKCKPFHKFYFKLYFGKLRISKSITLKLPIYYKILKSVIMASKYLMCLTEYLKIHI